MANVSVSRSRRTVRSMRTCSLLLLVASGCSDESWPTAPSPSGPSTLSITQVLPAAGGVVTITHGTPPGAFIDRNSGQVSVAITVRAGRSVPWAQLNVYLLTSEGYCGQNLPDAPTWRPFEAGQQVTYTVTAFQVYELPCEVVGVRAMLHTRNNEDLTPASASETVAEATAPARFVIR
jgi:hypothetical protein